MIKHHTIRSPSINTGSYSTVAIVSEPTIQQQPIGSRRTKNVDTHHGITIKWSLDSASHRQVGLPPLAASAAGAAACPFVGDSSC